MKFDPINIETQRLSFRKLEQNDCENIFEIYSNKKAMKYWSYLPFKQLKQAEEMIDDSRYHWDNGRAIALGIFCKDSQNLIGTVNLFNFHNESKRAEIAYMLDPQYWGLGIMTETLTALFNHVFEIMN
ncbi:MAG: GNAT family N-acetyltransferase, partial [Campylobacteraceae bacterium]|nr:GNAT family N-acetyltransferase [Campylobacteraceae bacterium]